LISKRKPSYRINGLLRKYLLKFGREVSIPIQYADLQRFSTKVVLYDKQGNDTLWQSVYFNPNDQEFVNDALKKLYALLKADGDTSVLGHLEVDRVDICSYANSNPFRIRIVNRNNDNFDYFYIKNADASRVYGLELEHILSPNRISFLTCDNTLIEEHIAGIPGEQFFKTDLKNPQLNVIRLAKEFVKFNERCLVLLLGDMHSSNYVIVTTPDFEEVYYRIRPIDFDQQCYEGKRTVYQPQYFKQNNPLIELGMQKLTPESVQQYQREERALMNSRLRAEKERVYQLMDVMAMDDIAPESHIKQLGEELSQWYQNTDFLKCKTMGQLVWTSLDMLK
jgi:hypothetical protein